MSSLNSSNNHHDLILVFLLTRISFKMSYWDHLEFIKKTSAFGSVMFNLFFISVAGALNTLSTKTFCDNSRVATHFKVD